MTPESLPRPPRRVRGRSGGGLWFGRIFTLPHTLIGIGAIGYLIFMVLWQIAGSDIPGTVTGSRISHSTKHGDSYILEYQFEAGGQKKEGSDSVSRALYDQYQPGIEAKPGVTVHYLGIGPLGRSALRTSGSTWDWIGFGFLLLWATFWNSILSVFVYQLWIKPIRTRQLYKNGEATAGVLRSKRVVRGKGATYYVSYSFTDPHSGREFQNEIVVWRTADWELAKGGQPVTVLFSRDNPKRSTVYEFGGYRVAGDYGSQSR